MNLFGKIATTLIGTRIAAETGKAGLAGVAAGMLATRVISRSPLGALVVGGAYVAHKLWQKKKQIDVEGPHGAAVADGLVEPDDGSVSASTKGADKAANAQGIGVAPPTP